MKNIVKLQGILMYLVIGFMTLVSSSCSSDDDDMLAVSLQELTFGHKGGTKSIGIISNVDWNIESEQDWCTVDTKSGNGDVMVAVTVTEFNGENDRTAKLNITASGFSTRVVTVIQKGNADEEEVTVKTISFESKEIDDLNWHYFSFKEGEFVKVDLEKANENLSWDIAFQRFYVKTNSGTSGLGKGGAIDTKQVDFDNVSEVPSEFIVDEVFEMMAQMGTMVQRSGSPAFKISTSNSWAWFEYQKMTWHYNNNVFVIKTADGVHYAKIIMKAYKNEVGDSGHITFDYIYPFK